VLRVLGSRRSGCAVVVAAVLAAAALPAQADAPSENPDLRRARAALDDLKYTAALSALDKALRHGKSGPAELAEIHRLRGEVSAALGREKEAVLSFKRLLAIDPNARLAAGTSPKIGEPFRTARQFYETNAALAVRCEIDRGPPLMARIEVDSDPMEMVSGTAAQYRGEDGRAAVMPLEDERFSVELPRGARAASVAAVDEHGNRLWVSPIVDCSDVTRKGIAPRKKRDRRPAGPPLYRHWGLWTGVALALGGVGTFFGLETMSTLDELDRINLDSSSHEFSKADELESRARRQALWSNIAFGAAGVAAVAAAILFLRRDRGRAERATVLAPTASVDSLGVALIMSF